MTSNRPTGRGSTPPHSFEFARTLSPSDPGPRVAVRDSDSAESVVVRDNTLGRAPSNDPLREKETVRDVGSPGQVAAAAVTPSTASEYVPPRAVPSASAHKTIETELVQLDPEVHPRTAQTIMDARRRARVVLDPTQVPTQAMPIQARRATRRRVVRAVASVVCLGVGAAFAVVLQGRGVAIERPQLHSSRPVEGQPTTSTPREQPTLAIDVRTDLEASDTAQARVDALKAPRPDREQAMGAQHAAHITNPWSHEPEASAPPSEQKDPQKRAVWLE